MRALRVLGMAEDGANLVCEEPESGDQYAIPADERLRAAARGDVSRLGQLEIEMEPQLRPREIQAKVRAGASIEQVAALAVCDPVRVERFAYPVLMERSAIADQARQARPITGGVLADRSIEAMVTEILHTRGHSGPLSWDAYKEEGAGWMLALNWTVGRSDNSARWSFTPGNGGGSVVAADESANELMDPAPRPLRTVRDAMNEENPAPKPTLNPLVLTTEPARVPAPSALLEEAAEKSDSRSHHPTAGKSGRPSAGQMSAALTRASVQAPTKAAAPEVAPPPAAKAPGTPAPQTLKSGKRPTRPAMPSWEDVLLGVRSSNR